MVKPIAKCRVLAVVVRREPIPPWLFQELDGRHFRDLPKLSRALLPLIRGNHKQLPAGTGPDELLAALRRFGFLFKDGRELWVSTKRESAVLARKATLWRQLLNPDRVGP